MLAMVFIFLAGASAQTQPQELPPPERREHINELLDEMEFEAGERWVEDHGRRPARNDDDLPEV